MNGVNQSKFYKPKAKHESASDDQTGVNISTSKNNDTKNYSKYALLTIKNPKASHEDFLRVAHLIKSYIYYTDIIHYYIERGKQHRRHIHLIVKMKKPFNIHFVQGAYKKFRNKKVISFISFVRKGPNSDCLGIITNKIFLKNYNWHLSPFDDEKHLLYVLNEYGEKEQDSNNGKNHKTNHDLIDFIDSDDGLDYSSDSEVE